MGAGRRAELPRDRIRREDEGQEDDHDGLLARQRVYRDRLAVTLGLLLGGLGALLAAVLLMRPSAKTWFTRQR
mgnify:CR=1 FL=1